MRLRMLKTRTIETAPHIAGETYIVDNEEIAFEWLFDGSAQDADEAPIDAPAPIIPQAPVDEAAERGRLAALVQAEQSSPDPTTIAHAEQTQEE